MPLHLKTILKHCCDSIIQKQGLLAPCSHGIHGVLLQNFVENLSEFSAAQRNAGKHVTIMSELSRLVDTRTLMQVCTTLAAWFMPPPPPLSPPVNPKCQQLPLMEPE